MKHHYSVDIFHILALQEYWGLAESRIPLKPVLVGVRIIALSISSHEQTLAIKPSLLFFILWVLSFSEGSYFADY